MKASDLLRFAAGALAGQPKRTSLALLGVTIGVLAVVVLTALGEGARLFVVNQFADLGTNLVIVIPGKTETSGFAPFAGGSAHDLTIADAEVLTDAVPGLDRLAPLAVGNDTVSHGSRSRQVMVMGSTPDFLHVRDLEIASGSFLPPGAMDRGSRVAVLGATVARELFAGDNPLGQVVRVGGWRLRVIGVLGPRGMHMGMDMNEVVIVPVATCMRMFDQSTLFRILLRVRSPQSVEPAAERVLAVLADRHGVEDVTIWTQDAVIESLSSILRALTMALGAIAAISLFVAGLGIMNVMLVAVTERRREIGLMKALGARNRQVRLLFLTEALVMSTGGGILGVIVGWIALLGIRSVFPDFPVVAPAWAVIAAIVTSITVGGVFGYLPARRATRLTPMEALSRR